LAAYRGTRLDSDELLAVLQSQVSLMRVY